MEDLTDGVAVSQVRALLARQGSRGPESLRTTVVTAADGSWVIRTWTGTGPDEPRPSGSPQFVHTVRPIEGGFELRQVHPPSV